MRVPPPGRLIDIGGFRLHLHATGPKGRTVVFDAALGGSSISWTYVQPAVAEFARACTYDRGGFGWSDRAPLPRTASRLADELHTLLVRSGESPPFVLVGHSFGGLVARVFAGRYRDVTAGLVLVDPAAPEDWAHPAPKEQERIDRGVRLCRQGVIASRLGISRLVSALVGAGAVGAARKVVESITRDRLKGDVDWLLAPLWKLPPAARGPLRSIWTQPAFFEALGSQIASISTSAAEALTAGEPGYGDLPLITISATSPSEHRVRRQEAVASLSTAGRHVVASNSGHWVPLDEPGLIVSAIREVIR